MSICPLSEKQLQAVQLSAQDKIVKTVAYEMGISTNVVTNYLQIARLKAGVDTTTGLVAKALREGWIK